MPMGFCGTGAERESPRISKDKTKSWESIMYEVRLTHDSEAKLYAVAGLLLR
jgi:hypothetical protein